MAIRFRQNSRTVGSLTDYDLPDLQIDTAYPLGGNYTFQFEIKLQVTHKRLTNGMKFEVMLDCLNEPRP